MTTISLIISSLLAVIVGGIGAFSGLMSEAGPDTWTVVWACLMGVGLLGIAFCPQVWPEDESGEGE